jgi:F-type H+-transporting ATPase subunit a
VLYSVAFAAEEEASHGLTSSVFFTIGPLEISEHIFSAWVVMAVLLLFSWAATRKLSLIPSGVQNVAEMVIETWVGIIEQTAGPKGRRFLSVVVTAFLFILFANWMGTLPLYGNVPGFESPNSNLNIPAAMAVVVFVLIQFYAIRALGFGGYLKEFFVPNPLHILTELTRPVSLSLRLFGNIFAGGVLVHTMLSVAPLVTFPFLGLELFVGVIQALIFSMLSMVFLSIATAHEHGAHAEEHGASHH